MGLLCEGLNCIWLQAGLVPGSEMHRQASVAAEQLPPHAAPEPAPMLTPSQPALAGSHPSGPGSGGQKKKKQRLGSEAGAAAEPVMVAAASRQPPTSAPSAPLAAVDPGADSK